MKTLIRLLITLLLSVNLLYSSEELQKVSLQLDWKFQFQHAGFIMAKEKGFYKDEGLDVTLLEYKDNIDIEDSVINANVDFGISNTPLMFENGLLKPVVLLATYLQRSPLVFVTQPDIKEPLELDGKKIMATRYEYENSTLTLLMEHFFVKGIYVPHTYRIKEFKEKKVDAMSAFISNELYELDKQNIPYNIIDPYQYGFVTNAMNLFTSYKKAQNNPQRVKKFLKATKKGWKYAIDNIEETIHIIHKKYNHTKSIEALTYEAKKIKELMLLGIYDIGEVSKELVFRAYKQLYRSGKVLKNQENRIMIFDDILKGNVSQELFLTEEEMVFLDKKGVVKLCVNPNWMPFEGKENRKYVGIVADYFDLVRDEFGINIEVQFKKSWVETLDSMKNGECDIIGTASPTPKRLKYMNFTDAYMKLPIVLVTKIDKPFIEDIEVVTSKKLGITKGYAIGEILKSKYPNINLVAVKNIKDGLKKVESGEIYGYIDNLSVIASNIQKYFHGTLKVSARLNESDELTIGSRNDEPMLNEIFQKVIHSIDKSKVREILNKWISVKESVSVDYTFLWEVVVGVAILLLVAGVYSYQLRMTNKKLEEFSREDSLTKVGNRLKLNEILEDMHKYTMRYNTPCGVMIIDIDDFKKVNDTFGHLVGDEVLKQVASIFLENIRQTDKLGRWGGEEFLIVCPNTDLSSLVSMAESLRKEIENYDFGNNIKNITVSFGLSFFDGKKDIEEVLSEADENLYKAKSLGKNRVCATT